MRVVIDANVLIAANNRDTHVGPKCSAACGRLLLDLTTSAVILEDDCDLVWQEYKRYCNFSGQPGAGDRFFQWFLVNRGNPQRVKQVSVGCEDHELEHHLPSALRTFDRSDRKWLAVYLVGLADKLFNAADSDYSEAATALAAEGIIVTELCPEALVVSP